MLEQVVILSLACTGVYVCFDQGQIFGWLRISVANGMDRSLGKRLSRYIQKPIWDCLPCMASIWTCLFTWSFDPLLIICVCGLNKFIDILLIGDE